jgi:hypothetical protein
VVEDSDLFTRDFYSNEATPPFEVSGTGRLVAVHDAWSDTPSYGPVLGQIQYPAAALTSPSAEDSTPHAQLTVSGPVTSSAGVRGVGADTITLVSDLGLDETQPPAVYLAPVHGAARLLAGKWISPTTWQATVRATPRDLPSGWSTVLAVGGRSCATDAPLTTASEVVHLDATPIVPSLAATPAHGRRVRLAWSQRGEQAGTTFAVRSRVERRGSLWRKPASLRRLTGHRVATAAARHRTTCYEVRAKLFGTKSAWSTRRCVAA